MKLTRTPSGAFMSQNEAIYHWLPLMIRWVWRDPIGTAIEAIQRYCITQFHEQFKIAAGSCDWESEGRLDISGYFQAARAAEAAKWLKKRDILRKAAEEIRLIDAGGGF